LGFEFAIEDIDPSVGTITAKLTDWDENIAKPNKNSLEIKFVDCNELAEGGKYEGQNNKIS